MKPIFFLLLAVPSSLDSPPPLITEVDCFVLIGLGRATPNSGRTELDFLDCETFEFVFMLSVFLSKRLVDILMHYFN